MNGTKPETAYGYACEPLAGCVYSFKNIQPRQAKIMSKPGIMPHVIELVAKPERRLPEYRRYYALDLSQAVAKAAELLVRMRRQRVRIRLLSIRPAADAETEAFFKELAKYDGHEVGETCRCRP